MNIKRTFLKALIFTVVAVLIVYILLALVDRGMAAESRIPEALFFGSLVLFLFALSCIVRNGGLFKSLSYINYRIKKSKEEEKRSFADYVVEKYENKWNALPFFMGAFLLQLIYWLIFFIF